MRTALCARERGLLLLHEGGEREGRRRRTTAAASFSSFSLSLSPNSTTHTHTCVLASEEFRGPFLFEARARGSPSLRRRLPTRTMNTLTDTNTQAAGHEYIIISTSLLFSHSWYRLSNFYPPTFGRRRFMLASALRVGAAACARTQNNQTHTHECPASHRPLLHPLFGGGGRRPQLLRTFKGGHFVCARRAALGRARTRVCAHTTVVCTRAPPEPCARAHSLLSLWAPAASLRRRRFPPQPRSSFFLRSRPKFAAHVFFDARAHNNQTTTTCKQSKLFSFAPLARRLCLHTKHPKQLWRGRRAKVWCVRCAALRERAALRPPPMAAAAPP